MSEEQDMSDMNKTSEVTPEDVISFWIDEVGPEGWYRASEDLDDQIRKRFLPAWNAAFDGEMFRWCDNSETILAFLILTDQLPRNMFRDDERAFATDALARTAGKMAIDRRWDLYVAEPQRQFFYLPLMHAENLGDQDLCIRLMTERLPQTGASNLVHARAHREIIRRFGRFPYRNEALRRMTLPSEADFLANEGYGAVLAKIEAKASGD